MANPIPPLLCSTPPPMDFEEETSANNDANDDFCEFDTGDTETFDGQSLPSTPRHLVHTINKTLESPLAAKDGNNATDTTTNTENIYCDFKSESIVAEKESDKVSVELDMKKIEKHKNKEELFSEDLSDYEENSKLEKSLELLPENLSEYYDKKDVSNYIDTQEELYFTSVDAEPNNKMEILKIKDKNIKPFEEKMERDNFLNIQDNEFSHMEINELSASKNQMLESNIENINYINESNSDISNSKSINKETDYKKVSNEINREIENNEDEIISNVDEIYDLNLESKLSEHTNADNEECNFTFEADFSQFQAFESFDKSNNKISNQSTEISNLNNSTVDDNVNVAELEKQQSYESFDGEDVDEFENFQNYSSQTVIFPDKDDSNQFTDFKVAAPPPLTETSTRSNCLVANSNLKEKIKSILNTMFPENENDNKSNNDTTNINRDFEKNSIILNSVDSATALDFQWSNSTIKHSLVKSIGIDSRNILHGEKWNSSMPRFAANLGFNPLEPLKPVRLDSIANTSNFLESEPSTSLGKVVVNRTDVPAVEFDWNTSGLVNPLDGAKEVIHKRKTETLHATQPGELQETSEAAIKEFNCTGTSNSSDTKSCVKGHEDKESLHTKEYLSTFDTNLIVEQTTGPALIKTNNLENIKNLEQLTYTNYQSSENIDVISASSSSNTNTFIVPLKETHIFTPSKSDAAISRSTTNISDATTNPNPKPPTPIDFDYEIAAAGTVIDETVIKKEYRDIEYNPSKFILNNLNTNCIELNENQNSLNAEKSEISEEPLKNEQSIANGGWDFYNNIDTNIYALDNIVKNKNDTNLTKELSIDTHEGIGKFQDVSSMEKFNIPAIGLSPTENVITTNEFHKENKEHKDDKICKDSYVDDEFTDFQFVPPSSTLSIGSLSTLPDIKHTQSTSSHSIKLKDNRINTIDRMILSPAILLPQTVQINCEPKIDWPEPGIDPEELARIETLFPSSKQNNVHYKVPISLNHSGNKPNETTYTSSVNNDDDWSDFISVPAVSKTENNLNTIYCPKSPTKVAKSSTTVTEFSNDDEWSDFISSTSSTNTMNLEQFHKTDNGQLKKNFLVNKSYNSTVIIGTNTSQQNYRNIVPNQISINSNNDQTMINNKICQYLLNNGNVERKDAIHSLKNNDFIMQQPYQQQNTNQKFSNHHKVTPNISLIPDLGYVAPQNFINIPKKNLQKK